MWGNLGSIPGVGKIWRRKWQPTLVFLPGKSHGQRNLVGYGPWITNSQTWLSNFTFTFQFNAKEGSQETPGVTGMSTEWSRAKGNRILPRERTGHSKHPLPTMQEKTPHMDITRWSTSKSDYCILCSQIWRSSIQSAKTRLGLTVAQIMNSLWPNSGLNWRK